MRSFRFFILLLLLHLAPACAPTPPDKEARDTLIPLVLLTDTGSWSAPVIRAYRDSLGQEGFRVLVSGYAGESPQALRARLPWLLQPGVGVFIYDEALAGPDGADTLRSALQRMGLAIPVRSIRR